MIYDVADLVCLERAVHTAQDLVGAARTLVHHELLGEAVLARISTIANASSTLSNSLCSLEARLAVLLVLI